MVDEAAREPAPAARPEEGSAGRRRHWPRAAAVAAATVLLAGGVYGVQHFAVGDRADVSSDSPAPLTLEAPAGAGLAALTAERDQAAALPGGLVYEADGTLPAAPGDTAAHRLEGAADAETVAALAAALGVAGEVTEADGQWQAGAELPDGELRLVVHGADAAHWRLGSTAGEPGWTAPSLGADGGGMSSGAGSQPAVGPEHSPDSGTEPAEPFHEPGQPDMPVAEPDPGLVKDVHPVSPPGGDAMPPQDDLDGLPLLPDDTPATDGEPEPGLGDDPDSAVSSDADAPHGAGGDSAPDAAPPSAGAAESAVAPLAAALDMADAQLDASVTHGGLRLVTVRPQVDGLPVHDGLATFEVNGAGDVVGGHGIAGSAVRLDDYPLVDAEEALQLLNEGAGAPGDDARQLAVSGAELGLGVYHSADAALLVPTWRYTLAEGDGGPAALVHPAVDPALLTGGYPAAAGRSADAGEHVPGQPMEPAEEPDVSLSGGVEPYQADDTTLTLRHWGGVCSEYTAVAEETAEAVTIVLDETSTAEMCVAAAVSLSTEVVLADPVGDRVLRSEDGAEIPVV